MKREIKKVGVVLRPSTPELKDVFFHVKSMFDAHNVEVFIDSLSAGMIDVLGQDFEWLCTHCDILVTLGGDGTLISTVRRSITYDIPVLGMHAGRLGFLADIDPMQSQEFIADLMRGHYRIDERLALEVHLTTPEGTKSLYAFNDVVITRPSISKMIHLDTMVEGKLFNSYYGDGLIICTPTGSTAYNLSSGGPVLYPFTHAFILTPICAHSLTQRPVVLPGHMPIELKTDENKAVMAIDGQEMYEFNHEDVIKTKVAPIHAKLIHRVDHNYFEVLREKLKWGR
jgi:NAD+ kinase